MSRQTIIIFLILIVLGAASVWFFYPQSSAPASQSPNVQGAASPSDIAAIEQELAGLRRLKDLQFETSVLRQPFLQSLQAPSEGVSSSISPGRANPFLPL